MSGSDGVVERWTKKFAVIEEAAAKWKPIGLAALQMSLPVDVSAVKDTKESLADKRKVVSQKTKEFSKLPTEEKAPNIGPLLKCYQGYIDDMTKALKHMQEQYLELNGVVLGMQDPTPLLSRLSTDRTSVLDMCRATEELERTKKALAERESELLELQNQEVTIQKLRDDLNDAELQLLSTKNVTDSAERENAELENIAKNWQQREANMQREITTLSQECRRHQLNATEYSNQLATARSKLDELLTTKETDLEGLLSEIDHLTTQVALVERSKTQAQNALNRHEEESSIELDELRQEVSQLEEQLHAEKQLVVTLRSELAAAKDMAGQAVASSARAEPMIDTNILVQRDATIKELEGKLVHAHRQLETVQAELLGATAEAEAVKGELHTSREKESALRKEILDLENELRQQMLADERSKQHSGTGGTAAIPQPFDLAQVVGPSVSAARSHQGTASATPTDGATGDGQGDALQTVSAQRDRYRQRLLALEEASAREMDNLKRQLFAATQENESLNQYIRTGGNNDPTGVNGGSAGSGVDGPSNGGGAFALRMPGSSVRTTVAHQVSVLDRAAILLTRFIVANDHTRRLFLVYILALHALVFIVLVANMMHM